MFAPGIRHALLLATVLAGNGCGCTGNVGGSDASTADSDGTPSSDTQVSDSGNAGTDFGVDPPQCLVGLISDDASSNLTPVFGLIDAMPDVGYDHLADNTNALATASPATIATFDVVIWYQHNRLITGPESATMEDYLQAGGRLLVTGHDSLGDPDDAMLAALVRSSATGDLLATDQFTISDGAHPIASGAFGSFATGMMFTSATPDQDLAEADVTAGAVTVAELSSGEDKIIATELVSGGIVVFWNGNGESTGGNYDAPDWAAGEDDMRALLRNTIAWLCAP